MPIDLVSEQILSFPEAVRLLPRRRRGRRPHISTLYRWAKGARGVRLEVIRTPGGLATSAEAIQRFFERLSAPTEASPSRTARQRERDNKRVERELDDLGL